MHTIQQTIESNGTESHNLLEINYKVNEFNFIYFVIRNNIKVNNNSTQQQLQLNNNYKSTSTTTQLQLQLHFWKNKKCTKQQKEKINSSTQ